MISRLAKKLIGTFIPEDTTPKPPTVSWVQEECRRGSLRPAVDEFIKSQDEPLEAELLCVEQVATDGITCVIPCKMFDRENPSAFQTEVRFRLDPRSGLAQRLEGCQ